MLVVHLHDDASLLSSYILKPSRVFFILIENLSLGDLCIHSLLKFLDAFDGWLGAHGIVCNVFCTTLILHFYQSVFQSSSVATTLSQLILKILFINQNTLNYQSI